MTEPPCFTKKSLAARWNCEDRVVSDMIKDGRLRTFTVGTRERIPMKEVQRIEGEEGNHETQKEQALAAVERLRSPLVH